MRTKTKHPRTREARRAVNGKQVTLSPKHEAMVLATAERLACSDYGYRGRGGR